MKAILIFLMVLLLISGCSKQNEQHINKTESLGYGKSDENSLSKEELKSSRIYKGLLPREDSQRIQTTLYMTRDYQQYQLVEELPGQSNPTIRNGNLNTERGFEEDRNAVVYVLDWDKEEDKQSFFVKLTGDSTTIYKLNEDKNMLSSYPLEKIGP